MESVEKESLYINGYEFSNKESFEKAKKEQEAIIYIKGHTDFNNINQVIKVYNKAIEKKMFATIIGYEFLKQMRTLILKKGILEESEITPIYIKQEVGKANLSKDEKEAEKYQLLYESEKTNKMIMKIAIVILLLVIACMIYISKNGKNSVISDYENRIINQYEGWETQLEEREKAVEEKEKELGIDVPKDNSINEE